MQKDILYSKPAWLQTRDALWNIYLQNENKNKADNSHEI